jgi:hypothetical protein
MPIRRSFLTVLIMVALPCATPRAFARLDPRTHAGPADDAQLRELLAKLAAASGEAEPEERTDADLMYEAMLRWNGEPPGSAAIDRALAQSKQDAARSKRATQDKIRRMFWKDPFSDEPHRLIPVRQEDRELLAAYARKAQRGEAREARESRATRESREPRDEVSRLRAELAAARAETARIRERAEGVSQRQGCVADASSSGEVRKRRRAGGGSVRSHHADRARSQIALASTTARNERYQPAPPPPSPVPPPAHGIIVVPLPSPSPPVVETGRRHGGRAR